MPAAPSVETLPATSFPGIALRLWRQVPVLAGLLLVILSVVTYAGDPAVPGNHGRFPAGWWGWWDQSQYILSARSLAHLDLAPSHHWYPLGYAILGAPFTLLSRMHPFLLPDLGCYLATYLAFLVFSRAVGMGAPAAALLFVLATAASEPIRHVWAEPWNTTLSTALIWWLLALTARHLTEAAPSPRRTGRMLAIGVIAGLIPVARPTDALLVAVWAVGAGFGALRLHRLYARDLPVLLLGGLLSFGPAAALWILIHGFAQSDYMRNSAALGFDFGTLGWRTELLLVSPHPWFPEAAGLLQRLPWILPGLAGLLVLPWTGRGVGRRVLLATLAAMIVAYCALFFAYVDLIPPGLWRYNNVHYFKWTLPGLVLLGGLVLQRLLAGPHRGAGFAVLVAACIVALLIDGLRLPARPVDDAHPAWMVQLRGPVPGWDDSYFGHMSIRDDRGEMLAVRDFRALPDRQGWRLVALRRPFAAHMVISGVGHWPDGPVPQAGSGTARWGRGLAFRWPFQADRPDLSP